MLPSFVFKIVHIKDMAEHMDMHFAQQIQGDHSTKVINYLSDLAQYVWSNMLTIIDLLC